MASTASDADQQWLRQSCAPPILHADTPPPCDGEALSGPGASQDTAIVIPEDSDAEDEGYGGEDSHSPQSYTTTATSTATHFSKFLRFGTFPGASPASQHVDSMGTKHSSTETGATITMETTPTDSRVGVEGDSIRVYGSHLDPSADPEPNVQTFCQTNSTSADDVNFDSHPTNTKSQPCQTMLGEQPITEATLVIPASSEPVAMTADDGSDEESGNCVQNSPVTPSRCTRNPMATTPEVRAQTPLSDGEVCLSAEQDNATIVHNPPLSPALSPVLPPDQGQDHDRRSCSSSDTESDSSEAEPGSLLGTQTRPLSCEALSQHRSRPTSLCTREMVQDKDGGDTYTEDSNCEDGFDVRVSGEHYCPSLLDVQRYESGDNHEDEELNCRKHRNVFLSPRLLAL